MKLRPLSEIAYEVKDIWGKEFGLKGWRTRFYAAEPYLEAMTTLNTTKDDFGADSGSSIVAYFLGNVTTWRGDDARRIKKELNEHLKA